MRRATIVALAALIGGCGSLGVRVVVQPGPGGAVITTEEDPGVSPPMLVRVERDEAAAPSAGDCEEPPGSEVERTAPPAPGADERLAMGKDP